MSRLQNLSHLDFEDLCRDIARAETGYRFSAFGPGPDGGIDGRYSKDEHGIILQCKHYIGSRFSALKAAVTKEIDQLPRLAPSRYILFTSQSLTPSRSDQLAALLGEYLKDPSDVWGLEDIEASLRRHPTIEKSHPKLWLGSTTVLERILHSGLEVYTQITKQDIIDELKVYVRNASFDEAASKLEEQKVLIVSGPPGVGKTTLAKMLTYHYLNEGWRFCAIRTLEDGFEQMEDETPTIFFFDDFLGRIKLDRQSLLQRESAFSMFIRRIKNSTNDRFVLTTRAHIFEEARRISDYVDDRRLQLSKYLLDVGSYTRKVRAYILYNHLSASNLSRAHFEALLAGDWLKKIIDHKNYNPRIIALASSDSIDVVNPPGYPSYLFEALENPELIWSKPLRALDMKSQNLLVALYFGSEFGLSIYGLRIYFSELHKAISAYYGQPTMPTDFEEALGSLESGFISISGQIVSFVNPSLRDFLKSYLTENEFLRLLPPTTQRADWGGALWAHAKDLCGSNSEALRAYAAGFEKFAETIESTPVFAQENKRDQWLLSRDDVAFSHRIVLLLEWWMASGINGFMEKALYMLRDKGLIMTPWRDGQSLPGMHRLVRAFVPKEHPLKAVLLGAIEDRLVSIVEEGVAPDDLINIIRSVEENMNGQAAITVRSALANAVYFEFYQTDQAVSHLESEQELNEHLEYLDTLAALTGEDARGAKEIVVQRLNELQEPDEPERRPNFSRREFAANEEFSDESMRNLFVNLLR